MDRLPDELIIHILTYLDVQDLLRAQTVCQRLRDIGRDSNIWKERCFEQSPAWIRHERYSLDKSRESNERVLELLRATASTLSGHDVGGAGIPQSKEQRVKIRMLAAWDPTSPGEHLDFQQEYVRRYAPIAPVGWCALPDPGRGLNDPDIEATGIGTLCGSGGGTEKLITPLSDGSVCIWDLQTSSASTTIKLSGQSSCGLLTAHAACESAQSINTVMTDDSAKDSVAIDSWNHRGLFAVQRHLYEVDLNTLQTVSCRSYPFAITALSDISPSHPLTVGTTSTIHLLDPRLPPIQTAASTRTELIAGPPSHAVLTQPNPLSILHTNTLIWVGGNFTHLLAYDPRSFPRLHTSLFSGARISSLTALGPSIVAAGVYKGKGSLEIHTPSTGARTINRATVARTRVQSVISHGATLVTADADGSVTWFERSATQRLRSYNINDSSPAEDGEQQEEYARKILPLDEGLLLWTSDGRVGTLGFGSRPRVGWAGGAEAGAGPAAQGSDARAGEERAFAKSMRRALEAQASEARFMRGLGLR